MPAPATAPSSPPQAAAPERGSVERKLTLGFSVAAALLLGMAAICFWVTAEFVKDNHWVEHTHRVIEEINAVLSDVKDMETCQRGYTILGGEAVLREYDLALVTLPQHLDALRELVADNSQQVQRLDKLTMHVADKVERMQENVAKRRRLGWGALRPENISGKGQPAMLLVRAGVQEMIATEKKLLAERRADRDRSLSATVRSLFCLGLLLSLLLAAIFLLGNHELAARRRLGHALAEARDQALEAARQKGEFLANMSHEIRTPLNGIVGMTGLMLDRPLDDEARDCAKTIETCAEALMGVINDILDFSKIEAGQLTFEHIEFDLGEVMDGALQILSGRAADKGLELNVEFRSGVPAGLRGDPTRLRQVFLNLIGNAIKFTERGEITLHVAPAAVDGNHAPGRAVLRFEVVDTGIGISEEARGRLFRAFSQADSSTTRKFGGTGLGLAISRELVGRMGGEIGVDSNPGVGSTFWFTADFELDPARPDSPANRLPVAAAALLGGRRLLIVDDNAAHRRALQRQLAVWGLNHTVASDAHRALAQMRIAAANRQPYHLVLLDMHLPGMDGLALAGEIKADADIAAARLVLMTSVNVRANALPPIISASLAKPVRSSQLLATLCKLASVLPAPAGAAPARSTPARRRGDRPNKPVPSILLVEDNPINQKVAQRQLKNLGCRIETAGNGREALETLERHGPFDLVLMDCQMPELDGYEATRLLREREAAQPDGASARHRQTVIAMTANAMEGARERCIDAGMDDYLPKPVKQDALEAVLRRWLPVPLPPGADGHAQDHAAVAAFVGGGG